MLELKNTTPFQAAIVPGMDAAGNEWAAVVVKGTFELGSAREPLPLAEEQVPLWYAPEYTAKPGESSLRYESDAVIVKKGTDVVLLGSAYARRGPVPSLEVRLQVGPLTKAIRVVGDRRWRRSLARWRPGDPAPFETMPLVYERAFGGKDVSHENPAKHAYEQRNPVGTGFARNRAKEQLEDLPLPNLEDPAAPIESWDDAPAPAGFGFIARDWMPRLEYAGTYDEAWQKSRCPLLPADFDERFFNAAHPGLVAGTFLKGGEPVRIVNASAEGDIACTLPRRALSVKVRLQGQETEHEPVLDTVVLEPEERRVELVWRARVPCTRKFLYIESVLVRERG